MGAVAETQAALRETLAYVGERTAFGRPLAKFQDTRFRFVALRAGISAAQAHIDARVLAHNSGRPTADEAAEAELVATELQGEVVDDCRRSADTDTCANTPSVAATPTRVSSGSTAALRRS
jgi:acyl-CoA dehydrogenase